MDKESTIALQKIDCNCNDCKFMIRDAERKAKWDETDLHRDQKNAGHRIHYGNCSKFSKPVSFIPNTLQFETQTCFQHRRDKT